MVGLWRQTEAGSLRYMGSGVEERHGEAFLRGLGREGEEYTLVHSRDAGQTVGSMWQQCLE